MTVAQRFMRVVTTLVVRTPLAWRVLRAPVARNFDRLAPQWDARTESAERIAAIGRALDRVEAPPTRVLDVGTGTGAVARLLAERWPQAEVVGVDLSPGMIEQARQRTVGAERYEVADASRLPFPDESFDLVTLNNMIPFFDELVRVTAPGGLIAVAYSRGDRTPIYVPLERVRRELAARGADEAEVVDAPPGAALLARKRRLHSSSAAR